jgi:hypothetical protein
VKFSLGRGVLSEEEKREIAQRQERIRKDADPLVLRRSARWEDHGMLPNRKSTAPPPPLPMAIRPQPTHFDRLADWRCGYLGVRQEFETTYEQQQDLKECVPQAILRDIYRPVKNPQVEWERHGLELDPGGRNGMAEAKKAQQREPLPAPISALAVFVSEQLRRRRFKNTPWQPQRPDSTPRHYSAQDHIHYNEVATLPTDDDPE